MRRLLCVLSVVFALLTVNGPAQAATTPPEELAKVKALWVKMVRSHVRAVNDYAKAWGKPEVAEKMPTSWADLAPKYRQPALLRHLRAIARSGDVSLDAYGWLRGKDAKRDTVRSASANGNGGELRTEWKGGQRAGGQSWDHWDNLGHYGHYYQRGVKAARRTGKPAGEKVVRNVGRI